MLAAAAVTAAWLWRPSELRSQGGAAEPPGAQFRVMVGLKNPKPARWTGRVSVEGGGLAGLEGWRFSPGDSAGADGSFSFATKAGRLENQLNPGNIYGQTDWDSPLMQRMIPQGLLVRVRGGESARVTMTAGAATIAFRVSEVPFGMAVESMEGDARVERMPVVECLSERGKSDDWPSLAIAPDGSRWVAWLAYENAADEVVVSGGGSLHRLTKRGDHHSPVIASDGAGRIQVVWSQNDAGNWHLYGVAWQKGKWSKPEKLTAAGGSNLWPALAADGAGKIALVWQGFRDNQSVILGRLWNGSTWSAETRLSEGPGNAWMPAAAFGGGKLWTAWDSYDTGSYQIYAREWGKSAERLTRGEDYSARATLAVTQDGVPVVAWEESDAQWGKDFAFLYDRRGTTLYKNRRIRVAWRDGGTWKETAASVAASLPEDIRRFVQQPQLALDGDGRIYLAFRVRTSTTNSRMDYFAGGGRWEVFLTALSGERWERAIPMHPSMGRNGMRPALAVTKTQVHVVWPTDNRAWPQGRYGDLEIHAASLPAQAAPAKLDFSRPIEAAPVAVANIHPNERADIRRIRDYRYRLSGKTYRVLRGDLHRHTELSGDGAGDGSLDDLYRYFLDAAGMDFAHVGDHQMGNDEEYNWWITQKSNDLYYMPERLVPMYGYERSVRYPNGHRNIIWAERGKPVLRISPGEAKGVENSGAILYPYLKETRGIVTSHTSATEQGTDWRDSDPDVEPIVELYQGFESNYEHAGAPRAWKQGEKAVHQGLRPLGYIWSAWAKGIRMGVQASSDHISTHVSYACILAEEFTRKGLLDAMKKRHAYAATDNIVLDFRLASAEGGMALMGDIVESPGEPKLLVKALGTGAIRQIDVIRNNTYVHKVNPGSPAAEFEFVDRASTPGESYYYVRVEQADGQLAWSSPIWVRRR
jgi:hypothetical protein